MRAKERMSTARREPAFHGDHTIRTVDPELWVAIKGEHRRPQDHIEFIASENYVSPAVMEAQGSQPTNKYAEGYPGRRYYGGCEFVDVGERLAIDRVKSLFGAEYANVQPLSGSQANQAVYPAVLKPGDVILGMSLAHGGHLTHGTQCERQTVSRIHLWADVLEAPTDLGIIATVADKAQSPGDVFPVYAS